MASGRATEGLSRRFGHHGTALPGLVAEWLDPAILAELRGELGQVVVVLGTNGKTTTTPTDRHRSSTRRPRPQSPIAPAQTSDKGLITAMIADRRPRHRRCSRATRSSRSTRWRSARVVDALRPDVVVLLNLLRDQLDRYGELDMIEDRWVRDLTGLPPETAIVVCADDPRLELVARRVARARQSRRPIARFGIERSGPGAATLNRRRP